MNDPWHGPPLQVLLRGPRLAAFYRSLADMVERNDSVMGVTVREHLIYTNDGQYRHDHYEIRFGEHIDALPGEQFRALLGDFDELVAEAMGSGDE